MIRAQIKYCNIRLTTNTYEVRCMARSRTVCFDSWNGQRYNSPIQLVHSANFLCSKEAGT